MPKRNDTTVVVATRNEERNIARFLASVPPDVDLVVVDKSSDATPAIVSACRPCRTKVLSFDGTLTAARQLGAAHAAGDWLLFTDADVVFDTGYFERLEALAPGDVIYGPKLSSDEFRAYYEWFARGQRALDALAPQYLSRTLMAALRGAPWNA